MATIRRQQAAFSRYVRSRDILNALQCTTAFCVGTLMCLLPNYTSMWTIPASAADQITFTLLGGVSKPLGGFLEQILARLGGGTLFAVPMYTILMALGGHSRPAQGILYALFVFVLAWAGGYNKFVNAAMLFAQTACTYAIVNSYRSQGAFHLLGLKDLLRGWAFGAAVSVFVNFVVFPRYASKMLMRHFDTTIQHIEKAIEYMFGDDDFTMDSAELNSLLLSDVSTASTLLRQASFEVTYQRAKIDDLREMVQRLDDLALMLSTCVIDGRYYKSLQGQLREELRVPSAQYLLACRDILKKARTDLSHKRIRESTTLEPAESPLQVAAGLFSQASNSLTGVMLPILQKVALVEDRKMAEINSATHCISVAVPLAERLEALTKTISLFADQNPTLQCRIFRTLWYCVFPLRQWIPSNPFKHDVERNPFLPSLSLAQRVLKFFATDESVFAFKITAALLCLLSILWNEATRPFFLQRNLTVATVPLILALITPHVGSSIIIWIAEFSGTASGILFGALTTLTWRGVSGAALNVPGIIFFEFLFTICFAWRLAWEVDDMLAVIACFSLGAFVNQEFQFRHLTPIPVSLPQHVEYALTAISIAIAIAIPFQFLVLRRDARSEARLALSSSMRAVASNLEYTGSVYTQLLLSQNPSQQAIIEDCQKLRGVIFRTRNKLLAMRSSVESAMAEFYIADGFKGQRFEAQIAALQQINSSCDIAARILSMGLFDPRVLTIVTPDFAQAAADFCAAASTTLWCHSASLALLQDLPKTLPPVQVVANRLYQEMEISATKATHLGQDEAINSDLRRLAQLAQLLVSQKKMLDKLADYLRVDWDPSHTETAEDNVDYVEKKTDGLDSPKASLPSVQYV